MKNSLPRYALWMGLCAAVLSSGFFAPEARAQASAPPPAADATARTAARPVSTVVGEIAQATQMTVLADKSVASKNVTVSTQAVSAATLENELTLLVRRIGPGTQWVKLMLPQQAGGRVYKGDDVADYALAQAKLFGNVGAATSPGVVEIMGQKVSDAQATPVVSTLNLKPVYVVINPSARAAANTVGPAANWSQMSREEQQAYTAQQVAALKNMTPEQRTQMMQQQGQVMRSYFQSMSPQERQQMFQGMGRNGGNNGGGRRNRGN